MSEDYRAKPQGIRKLITWTVVAAFHAVLFVSYRSPTKPVPVGSVERSRTIFLVPPRVTTPAVNSEKADKPSPGVSTRKRLTAQLTDRRAAIPGEVAAGEEVSPIETTADVAPDWTAGPSAKPEPIRDIKAYSLSLAGKADAQARQGKPAPLEYVDTPFKRMQEKMALAARGGGNSTTTAMSSSGEPITIVTRGGKMRCYVKVSTSVAPSAVFDNRGSSRSTEVQCPKELR